MKGNRWLLIVVALLLYMFFTKPIPIKVACSEYYVADNDGSMYRIEADGRTGTVTHYQSDGSTRQWTGDFSRIGFKKMLVYGKNAAHTGFPIQTAGKKLVRFSKAPCYQRLEKPAFEGHFYGPCSIYPGTIHLKGDYNGVAELGRENGSAFYRLHTFPSEAGIATIDYPIEEYHTEGPTFYFSPENFCRRAEFTDDGVIMTGENGTFTLAMDGTTAAEPFVDDTFDGTLMSLPCIECDGLIAISPKSANSIKLADGGSANSGIFVGDVNALGGYIVYELDGRFSKLSFRDAALQDGSKYIVSYNISGDGREISIADNGDGTYSCDVTNVQELKVELGYRWGFCGHFMTDVIIE